MKNNQMPLLIVFALWIQTAHAGLGSSRSSSGVAELNVSGRIGCSAVLICNRSDKTRSYYLSAAHCVKPAQGAPPDTVTFNGQPQSIISMNANPKFNGTGAAGDFSVLVTNSPYDDTDCCELPDANLHAGAQMKLEGYGMSSSAEANQEPPPQGSKAPKENPVSLESASTAQPVLKVRGATSNTGCQGDSGGPISASVGGKCVVYGVVSGNSAHTQAPCNSGIEMASAMHEAKWINDQLNRGGAAPGSDSSSSSVASNATFQLFRHDFASCPIEPRQIELIRYFNPSHRAICAD